MTQMLSTPRAGIRLEILDIPNPCPADWSAMKTVDGERVRFCRHCEKHVYNLSAMTRDKAEKFMAGQVGNEHLCLRLYKRVDGTVVTADCRGKWRASAVRWASRWGGPVGAMLSLALAMIGCDTSIPNQGALVYAGGMAPPPTTRDVPASQPIPLMGDFRPGIAATRPGR